MYFILSYFLNEHISAANMPLSHPGKSSSSLSCTILLFFFFPEKCYIMHKLQLEPYLWDGKNINLFLMSSSPQGSQSVIFQTKSKQTFTAYLKNLFII